MLHRAHLRCICRCPYYQNLTQYDLTASEPPYENEFFSALQSTTLSSCPASTTVGRSLALLPFLICSMQCYTHMPHAQVRTCNRQGIDLSIGTSNMMALLLSALFNESHARHICCQDAWVKTSIARIQSRSLDRLQEFLMPGLAICSSEGFEEKYSLTSNICNCILFPTRSAKQAQTRARSSQKGLESSKSSNRRPHSRALIP